MKIYLFYIGSAERSTTLCGTWGLADNLGSLRDIADFNESTGVTTIANHRVFSSTGKLVSETNSAVDLLFAFTGKQLDDSTGLQHNLFRWYDANLGQWLSEDPLGFAAGDDTVRRYVGNRVTHRVDPTGLEEAEAAIAFLTAVERLNRDYQDSLVRKSEDDLPADFGSQLQQPPTDQVGEVGKGKALIDLLRKLFPRAKNAANPPVQIPPLKNAANPPPVQNIPPIKRPPVFGPGPHVPRKPPEVKFPQQPPPPTSEQSYKMADEYMELMRKLGENNLRK